ncbi:MAG: hypothetical protein FWC73_12130 [Defluviitaleaceae bacterium]|nr:hypothetical protein [Defluviitaleaceae bacterium]
MRALYETIKAQLARIDFEAIWPGFTPVPFALVGSDQVYLDGREIPKGDGFWANTSMEFEGAALATWCVDKPETEDPELLAANIVHEMFHAFQSTRWAGEGGDEFALMAYPDDLTAYRIKAAEISFLLNAYTNSDPAALTDFINLRKSRAAILGDAIIPELISEEGEGTAEYAGLEALKQLSHEKYEKLINESHIPMLTDPEKLFSVRFISYFTGAFLCLTLKKLGIDFYHSLGDPRPLFEVISGSDTLAEGFQRHYSNKKAKFDDFLTAPHKVIEKNAKITGFDPMNMWRLGNQYYCARFVNLDGEGIPGPVILNLKPGSTSQVVGIVLHLSK